jgi:hypothetical protein
MQRKRSSSARGLLLVAAISLMVAACGSGDRATDQGSSQAPATTQAATDPPDTTSADPLQGEWRTEYTCQQSVRAIRARLSDKQILKLVGSWKSFIGEEFGGKPTEDDPCHGATGTDARLARFADGNLALCDAGGGCPVQATYELVSDHSITINDPEGNLCPCPQPWDFEIAGDQLTFHVQPADPSTIHTWEAAPWTREG